MVLVTKIEGDRVYFRNPWGASMPPGSRSGDREGPDRRSEDFSGHESITLADFRARIKGFIRAA
jgi:hypothetical protein